MWYKSESSVKPELEDTTSSRVVNYARKNIKEVEREDMNGKSHIVYEYDEIQIAKADWWLFKENNELKVQLAEQADAICELAEIIAEVE